MPRASFLPATRSSANRHLLRGNPPRFSTSSRTLRARLHPLQRLYTPFAAPSALQSRPYTAPTMALNASSHNVTGEKTSPNSAAPPPVAADSKDAILAHANADGTGQSAPGQAAPSEGGEKNAEGKVKTAKELEKERKKAEKDAKFQAKKAAQAANKGGAGGAAPKEKKKKAEKETLPEYVEQTPKGMRAPQVMSSHVPD